MYLNTCLLIFSLAMRDFECRLLNHSMMSLLITAVLHLHVLSTTMLAWAFYVLAEIDFVCGSVRFGGSFHDYS